MTTAKSSQKTQDAPEDAVVEACAAPRRRAKRFTVPALAAVAAGAAAVLVTVPVGGPHSAQARDNASVVRHDRAATPTQDAAGMIIDYNIYSSGQVNSDGSLSDLGSNIGGTSIGGDSWNYQTPNGALYSKYGSLPGDVTYVANGPLGNGEAFDSQTKINATNHTYSQTRRVYSDPAAANADTGSSALDIASTPAQVQQALQQGQATQKGTTTVNGTQALALSVPSPGMNYETWLYVDAQSDQPLREVHITDASDSDQFVTVFDWRPATPDNIAQAKESIPAGYTKVPNAF